MTTGDHARQIKERLHRVNPDDVIRESVRPLVALVGDAIDAGTNIITFFNEYGGLDGEIVPPDADQATLESAMDWALVGARAYLSLALRFSHASDPGVTVGPPTEVPDR
jgi:hypothetical protein